MALASVKEKQRIRKRRESDLERLILEMYIEKMERLQREHAPKDEVVVV